MHDRTLKLIEKISLCVLILLLAGSNATGQQSKSERKLTPSQKKAKYEKLRASVERVEDLKKRGHRPKTIAAARESVEIAEEEFGKDSFVIINPVFTLAGLLGDDRQYEAAEKEFKKIYAIIDSDKENYTGYAAGYRIWIARLYIDWNMPEKAEAVLNEAKVAINMSKLKYIDDRRYKFDNDYFGQYTKSIELEMQRIEELKEANLFKK